VVFIKQHLKASKNIRFFCGFWYFWFGLRFYFGSIWVWTPLLKSI